MLGIIEEIARWREPFALATVVGVWRSAPRGPGAAMALHPSGAVVGSVSVGCIEADLYLRCEQVIAGGAAHTVRYGISADDAGTGIGMTCGGEIEVFVQRIDPAEVDLAAIESAQLSGSEAAVVQLLDGPDQGRVSLVTGPAVSVTAAEERATEAEALAGWPRPGGRNTAAVVTTGPGVRAFVAPIMPPPRLLVFGAVDFAAAIADVARLMDYRVTVCDARAAFATADRFPTAHEVVVDWPHRYLAGTRVDERTAICVLSHDPKFDEPLLEVAAGTPAGYIGVMGSRQTHTDRLARLRRRGLSADDLARFCSPMGLDLGGVSPHETALSIMAEIVARRRGGTGAPLAARHGPIHTDRTVYA